MSDESGDRKEKDRKDKIQGPEESCDQERQQQTMTNNSVF
jgi:hypothetical protein